MIATKELLKKLFASDKKALARCITMVENEMEGYKEILSLLKFKKDVPVIGVTGPPGAGKSTLINCIIKKISEQGKTAGVVAVDPSSPFSFGSLLGDRVRMSEHFTDENIFIRSLATRGALGGLSEKTADVVHLMRASGFDYVIVETVGVGQSEVKIVEIADVVLLVLVPESGDEVQALKSGIMEIADLFVVNKADRDGADIFVKNLIALVQSKEKKIPIVKTIATAADGVNDLMTEMEKLRMP